MTGSNAPVDCDSPEPSTLRLSSKGCGPFGRPLIGADGDARVLRDRAPTCLPARMEGGDHLEFAIQQSSRLVPFEAAPWLVSGPILLKTSGKRIAASTAHNAPRAELRDSGVGGSQSGLRSSVCLACSK